MQIIPPNNRVYILTTTEEKEIVITAKEHTGERLLAIYDGGRYRLAHDLHDEVNPQAHLEDMKELCSFLKDNRAAFLDYIKKNSKN